MLESSVHEFTPFTRLDLTQQITAHLPLSVITSNAAFTPTMIPYIMLIQVRHGSESDWLVQYWGLPSSNLFEFATLP